MVGKKNVEQFDTVLTDALSPKFGLCLIDVHVDSIADCIPPVYSRLAKNRQDPVSRRPEKVFYLSLGCHWAVIGL
jgi:acetolactate synthase-1/2/3 large subunit